MGYRLVFQDGGKVYLEYSVTNSIALANQLRWDANRQFMEDPADSARAG